MKHCKLIVAAIAAVLLTASCGIFGGGNQSNTAKGNTIGESLLAIYTQYKKDGKVDLSNITNIINLANIASILRGHSFEEDNTEFISGLITGAQNTISQTNAQYVIGLLGQLSKIDMSAVTNAAQTVGQNTANAAAQAAETALKSSSEVNAALTTLSSIFRLMK